MWTLTCLWPLLQNGYQVTTRWDKSWHSSYVLVYPYPRGDLKIAKTRLSNQPKLNGDSITILQHTASTWCSLINNLAPCPHKKTCIIKSINQSNGLTDMNLTWHDNLAPCIFHQNNLHNRMCWPTTDCSFLTASIRCFLINILAPYISHQHVNRTYIICDPREWQK